MNIENPVQARAYARALVWKDVCELSPKGWERDGREFPVFFNPIQRQYKAVFDYTVTAFPNKPYLVDWDGEQFFWNIARTVAWLGDGDLHQLIVTYVCDETPYGLSMLRLSHRCQPHTYAYFHNEQVELGIRPGDPLYIHPYDQKPKDWFIAHLLMGDEFSTPHTALMQAMVEDETRIRLAVEQSLDYNRMHWKEA